MLFVSTAYSRTECVRKNESVNEINEHMPRLKEKDVNSLACPQKATSLFMFLSPAQRCSPLPWLQEPTVLRGHLQPMLKPHSWCRPNLLSAHSSCELWCVALGPPSGGVFHSYPHIPAYPPKTQADERGLKTHSGASQATQPMSNKVGLGSLRPCVGRVGPGPERASSSKDLVWKQVAGS